MPAVSNIRDYFELLKRSNLLSKPQLMAARDAVRDCNDARGLAKWLVKRGWLTSWQAQQLLSGHHRLFLGKYKLLDVVGQGGMGSVIKAEQCSVRRIVALKVMAKELLRDDVAIRRFLREIQSAAALNHPHIVAALDADCIGDRYFLVMEFVEGRDLKGWLKKYGPLPIAWTCEVIRQVALGLQHAHEHNMVHRDIKPSNIMVTVDPVTGSPHAKIMDFGLSRLVSETQTDGQRTRSGAIMGSPDYIAPEQASNARDADIRADLFSLGCTMFQMLTGQLPFSGNNIMEKLMARTTQSPPPVSSLRPDVPPQLSEIVADLLRFDPQERPQTPGELAARLSALDLKKPAATPVPTGESGDAFDVVPVQESDDTLNLFLDQLTAGASDWKGTSSSTSSAKAKPASWIAAGVAALCLLGMFLMFAAFSSGTPKSAEKSNSTASQNKRDAVKKNTTKPKRSRE